MDTHGEQVEEHSGTYLRRWVMDCEQCKFIHVYPIPDNRKMYEKKFYGEIKPDYLENDLENKEWLDEQFEYEWNSLLTRKGRALDVGCGYVS